METSILRFLMNDFSVVFCHRMRSGNQIRKVENPIGISISRTEIFASRIAISINRTARIKNQTAISISRIASIISQTAIFINRIGIFLNQIAISINRIGINVNAEAINLKFSKQFFLRFMYFFFVLLALDFWYRMEFCAIGHKVFTVLCAISNFLNLEYTLTKIVCLK